MLYSIPRFHPTLRNPSPNFLVPPSRSTMLEPKRDSTGGAGSQAPTIVPSRSSFEKEPSTFGQDEALSGRSITTPIEVDRAEVENEKQNDLAKAPTATSNAGGKSLQPTPTREDGSEYPSGLRLGLISLALCLSVFLMALDNSIIATAIPKITDKFHSLGDVGWYGSGRCPPPAVALRWPTITTV